MLKLIVGNIKMNILTPAERENYFDSFKKSLEGKRISETKIVVCPPEIHLEKFVENFTGNSISVGAQNCFWEDRGSFTGELSPLAAKNFGAEYVIIGHSERRKYFGETEEVINLKIRAALNSDLIPIYCIGESQEEKTAGKTLEVLVASLNKGLSEIPIAKIGKVVIAYEPIWAVGSDLVPNEDDILQIKILIKKYLTEKFGSSVAEKILILYGGSVNAKTVQQVCTKPGMDGVLVGRESLIPTEFIKIAEIIDNA